MLDKKNMDKYKSMIEQAAAEVGMDPAVIAGKERHTRDTSLLLQSISADTEEKNILYVIKTSHDAAEWCILEIFVQSCYICSLL